MMVIASIARDPQLQSLVEHLGKPPGVLHVSGLWGSAAPLVAAVIATRTKRPVLYLTAHLEQADEARDDLELFSGVSCDLFPAWETLPGEGAGAGEIEAERLRLCAALLRSQGGSSNARRDAMPPVIVAPVLALMQSVPTPEALRRNTLHLTVGEPMPVELASPQGLLAWAVERGYERLDLVESPGDVACRGEIIDLFAPGESAPYRFQFDGDRIETIRRFDVSTQRSMENLTAAALTAMPKAGRPAPSEQADLISFFPKDCVVMLDEPSAIQEAGRTLRERMSPSAELFSVEEVLASLGGLSQVHLSRFGGQAARDEPTLDLAVASLSRLEVEPSRAVEELCDLAREREVHVFCDTRGEKDRLAQMLSERDRAAGTNVHLHVGTLHRGFDWTATRTVVVGHHELFHRSRPRRRVRRLYAGQPLDSWVELKPGEFVVHVVHGIAVYRGLAKLRKGASNQQEEFLTLEFDDGAMRHAPCSQIDLVQKYIGAGGHKPRLSKLGGKRWARAKRQVEDAVADLAESLLRIQAQRESSPGTAYPDDTQWQREFEASFPFEETEDQITVAHQIRADLTRPRPMDRLVCGDVGYGKTELAMRAAFKVVEYGRQVAVLVPTTVLAEQHFATFRDRLAGYPFVVGCLSRFRSPAEQRKIIEGARKGRMDIVIGTHRLLSDDVRFANLGLVVVDEEQRFGVEHKEKLKAMRETVDVLTMTATPIPRTLDMALMGLRDISSLQTPPVDRRSIATRVLPFSRTLIRDAILREMNRDGQVFFIHNFVQSIAAMAATVQSIVPEACVIYGHGQMKDDELEDVMQKFVRKEADVLVATTIIESGIDIPSANTIFINRTDRFGLADMHQLRGRVGRSSHKAYCYLLLSPDRPPTVKAAKRLKTIEEFSELGAGFRIAMRDLEIRGAGNLLGREQSGHIAAVGYEMYCRLLQQSVRRLKNEPDPTPPPVQIDLDVAAHIPRQYIPSDRSRIDVYRRLAACATTEDLRQLEADLVDAFGPYPRQVERLLEMAEIRVSARRFGILSISLRKPDVVFVVNKMADAQAAFAEAPGTVRMVDDRTIHLRLPPAYLERSTLVTVLRRLLAGELRRAKVRA